MGSCSSSHSHAFEKTVEVPGLKIAIVGDQETGKSSIIARYIHNQFSPIYIPTRKAAIENIVRKLNVPGHATVPLTLWDIPGKEDLPLHSSYFRNLDAVIVVVDLSDISSIESAKLWHQTVVSTASFSSPQSDKDVDVTTEGEEGERQPEKSDKDISDIPFLLLGNKFDLIRNEDSGDEVILHSHQEDEHRPKDTQEESIDSSKKTKLIPECLEAFEKVAADGFVGSVMVSSKTNDLSVHAAIQSFLRHILEKKYVGRRWQVHPRSEKLKRPRYEMKSKFQKVGIDEIDTEFTKAEEIVHRVTALQCYQNDSLKKFAEQCVDIDVIQTTKDASMQNCLVALRDKLDSLDLKLKLKLQDNFCTLEVKASSENAELEKSIRYALKTFNKEYAAVTQAMLTEFPLAETKLQQMEERVEKLCQHYHVPAPTQDIVITNADLHSKAVRIERNRAVMRHTMHECHDCLAHIQRSVKQAKAAFVW